MAGAGAVSARMDVDVDVADPPLPPSPAPPPVSSAKRLRHIQHACAIKPLWDHSSLHQLSLCCQMLHIGSGPGRMMMGRMHGSDDWRGDDAGGAAGAMDHGIFGDEGLFGDD